MAKIPPRFYLPQIIHKIICHGSQFINHFDLPIENFSEQALETRNSCTKLARKEYSWKTSRLETMTDIIHHLLCTSEPFIDAKCAISSGNEDNVFNFLLKKWF